MTVKSHSKQIKDRKEGNRITMMRTIYNYAEIADIQINIEDIKKGNCYPIAEAFGKFFDGPLKQEIESIDCLSQLTRLLGSKDDFRLKVKLYRFSESSKKSAYGHVSHSVKATRIPCGGLNHRY